MSIVAMIAIVLAFIVKGMSGFANTLVFGTIMSFKTSNINITPLELIVGYPSNLYFAWKERKNISLKLCIMLSTITIIGDIFGTIILKNGDTKLLKAGFGLAVLVIATEMFFREQSKKDKKSSKVVLLLIGIISGMLCGLFGIGAFLVSYISRTTNSQNKFMGNLCAVFFIENTFRIILYIATDIINIDILVQALILIPFMIIGLSIGILLSKKVSEKVAKNCVILLLMLSGLSLVIQNIFI